MAAAAAAQLQITLKKSLLPNQQAQIKVVPIAIALFSVNIYTKELPQFVLWQFYLHKDLHQIRKLFEQAEELKSQSNCSYALG